MAQDRYYRRVSIDYSTDQELDDDLEQAALAAAETVLAAGGGRFERSVCERAPNNDEWLAATIVAGSKTDA